jgi:4-hydroxybenzoate polyprenyl transferase
MYFIGALCLRSAGCIVNDWADRNYDAAVTRTKHRPLACRQVTITQALGTFLFMMIGGVGVWLWLNTLARTLSLLAFVLLLIYPFMKRFTYWPQFVLGLAFNSGILIACAQINASALTTLQPWLLYGTGILWTLAYDTIYAFQDIHDDRLLGLKSTTILFQDSPYLLPALCYCMMSVFLGAIGVMNAYTFTYYIGLILTFGEIGFRLYKWQPHNAQQCLSLFKHNVWLGASVFGLLAWELL